ncbi:hypothetical protein CQW23_31059 [Capsicum baccatum]|uniref:Ubiquitin-like protease family profile domain-containing protein n=1 Tax=Capsicum baccatum TaxID=33114 RepID=A0A2G2V8N1_CAPBA|nr:hypothetical protein CQW23_31059 [Capsicum baccatum]
MQSYVVSKKVVVPNFKKVDKRKKLVGLHDFDSDFEDEIFMPKIKKSNIKISENARVTRSKVNVSAGKVDDKMSDKKKSRNVFKDILGHEYRSNDSDHSVPPITEDVFSILKNEIANVRRHMSLFQEKVDNQFNGMRGFVEESVKLILNELSESFHWILVIFRIRHRCLYVYDLMMEGVVHSKNVLDHVRSLSTMIPLFLVATNFYEKRSDIDWYWEAAYIDKSLSEPLEYVILKDTQQQGPQSNDCGMFVCAFAEYVSHGIFDISSTLFNVVNHRLRYGALLWNYATRKQNNGAVSESEATKNVTSKHGGRLESGGDTTSSNTSRGISHVLSHGRASTGTTKEIMFSDEIY